jgi:hypothetical protein
MPDNLNIDFSGSDWAQFFHLSNRTITDDQISPSYYGRAFTPEKGVLSQLS